MADIKRDAEQARALEGDPQALRRVRNTFYYLSLRALDAAVGHDQFVDCAAINNACHTDLNDPASWPRRLDARLVFPASLITYDAEYIAAMGAVRLTRLI